MSPSYLASPLPHQEGMSAQPEFSRTSERRNEVHGHHAGRRPIHPRGPSWVREGNPVLFDRQTGDCPHMDLYFFWSGYRDQIVCSLLGGISPIPEQRLPSH